MERAQPLCSAGDRRVGQERVCMVSISHIIQEPILGKDSALITGEKEPVAQRSHALNPALVGPSALPNGVTGVQMGL